MKFLIAGFGSIGRRHLRNLLALGQTDIVLYRTHHSTLPDHELAPFVVETDLEAALAHQPDGVIVSNPSALHLDVAIPAVHGGGHLLIEKPVADIRDARLAELEQVVDQKRVRTLVGFQFRFHPVLNQIRKLLASNALGRVYSFRVHWGEYLPGWHPWEDYRQGYAARRDLGGGVVNTLCHPLDYARWLFGEVSSVSAVTGHVSELELDVEDVAEITLNFESGCLGAIHLDYFQRPGSHWMTITCEQGFIEWHNDTGIARVYHAQDDNWSTLYPPEGFERNDLFLEEMRHFFALISGETQSVCDLAEGIRALSLVEAVHESSRSGSIIEV